jgi:hypothetical protein
MIFEFILVRSVRRCCCDRTRLGKQKVNYLGVPKPERISLHRRGSLIGVIAATQWSIDLGDLDPSCFDPSHRIMRGVPLKGMNRRGRARGRAS